MTPGQLFGVSVLCFLQCFEYDTVGWVTGSHPSCKMLYLGLFWTLTKMRKWKTRNQKGSKDSCLSAILDKMQIVVTKYKLVFSLLPCLDQLISALDQDAGVERLPVAEAADFRTGSAETEQGVHDAEVTHSCDAEVTDSCDDCHEPFSCQDQKVKQHMKHGKCPAHSRQLAADTELSVVVGDGSQLHDEPSMLIYAVKFRVFAYLSIIVFMWIESDTSVKGSTLLPSGVHWWMKKG